MCYKYGILTPRLYLEAIQLSCACWVCGSCFNHLTFRWSKESQSHSGLSFPTQQKYFTINCSWHLAWAHCTEILRIFLLHVHNPLDDPTPSLCTVNLQLSTHLGTHFVNCVFCGIRSANQLYLSLIMIYSESTYTSSLSINIFVLVVFSPVVEVLSC